MPQHFKLHDMQQHVRQLSNDTSICTSSSNHKERTRETLETLRVSQRALLERDCQAQVKEPCNDRQVCSLWCNSLKDLLSVEMSQRTARKMPYMKKAVHGKGGTEHLSKEAVLNISRKRHDGICIERGATKYVYNATRLICILPPSKL
jgi:hypothetical protein